VKILSFDGALGEFELTLLDGERSLATRSVGAKRALEAGLRALAEILDEAKLAPQALDRLAVGLGPGGFTGLRIALAYAKALAFAWQLPLVGISSFDTLSFGETGSPQLAVVAGRPGVISARLRSASSEARASGPIAEVLAELLPTPLPGVLAVVGAPEGVLAALAERGQSVNPNPSPTHPSLAIAHLARIAQPAASPHALVADYGEAPAAKIAARA